MRIREAEKPDTVGAHMDKLSAQDLLVLCWLLREWGDYKDVHPGLVVFVSVDRVLQAMGNRDNFRHSTTAAETTERLLPSIIGKLTRQPTTRVNDMVSFFRVLNNRKVFMRFTLDKGRLERGVPLRVVTTNGLDAFGKYVLPERALFVPTVALKLLPPSGGAKHPFGKWRVSCQQSVQATVDNYLTDHCI